jgi:hypothetical protein
VAHTAPVPIYTEIKRALDEEVVQKKFRATGVEPKLGTPSEVTKLLELQIIQWADGIRSGGIKIDLRAGAAISAFAKRPRN